MKKSFFIPLLLLIAFVINSCRGTIIAIAYNKKDPFKKKTVWVKDDREIIHIPMIHLAKQGYYDKVKAFVDEKHKEGYVVYYEEVRMPDNISEAEKDTLYRKVRAILGFHIKEAYGNIENKSFPKFKRKYVAQTGKNTGIDTLVDVHADMDFKTLIQKIENRQKRKIILNDCDFNTPLNAKYKCKNNYHNYRYLLTRYFRDDYLRDMLLNAPHKKIIVLYGAAHKWSLYPDLLRAGFTLTEGKWYIDKPMPKKAN